MQRTIHREARRDGAIRAIGATIASGAALYDRSRLSRLIPIGPDEIASDDPLATRRIVLRLARALRGERTRGRAGHWTYDLNRHVGLAQALRAERERLAREIRGGSIKKAAPEGTAR